MQHRQRLPPADKFVSWLPHTMADISEAWQLTPIGWQSTLTLWRGRRQRFSVSRGRGDATGCSTPILLGLLWRERKPIPTYRKMLGFIMPKVVALQHRCTVGVTNRISQTRQRPRLKQSLKAQRKRQRLPGHTTSFFSMTHLWIFRGMFTHPLIAQQNYDRTRSWSMA